MASYNKIILLGNLVREPELRYTPGENLAVARTAIAVNRKYKGKEEVMFIDFVVFGKPAEILKEYATKGAPILIDGRLSQSSWEQDGQKRHRHEIIVERFQLVGGKRDDKSGAGGKSSTDMDDDDIPF